jgi:predicted choloylglycine hydrolase
VLNLVFLPGADSPVFIQLKVIFFSNNHYLLCTHHKVDYMKNHFILTDEEIKADKLSDVAKTTQL